MRSVYTQYTVYPPFFSLQLCFLRPPFIGCLVGRFMLIGVNLQRDGLTGGLAPLPIVLVRLSVKGKVHIIKN